MGDVSETAAPWSKLNGVHDAVYAAAGRAFESLGKQGFIMCHLSHSYHAGACLYFTFAFQAGEDADREYATVKTAIQQAFVDSGGTLSHHHGVGMEHAPWMEQVVSEEGVSIMRSLFSATDPGNRMSRDDTTAGSSPAWAIRRRSFASLRPPRRCAALPEVFGH